MSNNGGKNGDSSGHKNGGARLHVASHTPWESKVGYSRAVRAGSMVFVSGTTATNEKGEIVSPSDPAEQARQALKNIEKALKGAGVALKDVVQTRIYVVDIDHWEEIGRVHAEFFKDIRPATSMIEVSSLVHPDMLVEIEAVAVAPEQSTQAQV
ncbi:MAG: RidA family protein [Elusimicrobia bacterium]|nr:RidA family protein [Elusimicrobiota bacterium]